MKNPTEYRHRIVEPLTRAIEKTTEEIEALEIELVKKKAYLEGYKDGIADRGESNG